MSSADWSAERAERHLLSLELFGMRFGLERMRRLLTALDSPQHRFESIHVVGTNGKSSVARMTASILERHGYRAGAYLSPHLVSFAERVRVSEADIAPDDFGAAVGRAVGAAELVRRAAPGEEQVTQFELLTAAALDELARREVEVAVVEAGLGGRHDATNVLPSRVQVLTSVGLEHTRWLGSTVTEIAREKLAVVQPGGTLVLGDLPPEAEREARAHARAAGARLVHPPVPAGGPALPGFQRRNLAVAVAAAEAFHGGALDPAAVVAAAAVPVPGRFERVGRAPETILDGAHNPAGAAALAAAVGEVQAGRPLALVVSVLDDKDAAGLLGALLPLCRHVVATASAHPRAVPPAALGRLVQRLGGPAAVTEADPRAALRRARALAGPQGLVLVCGSIYLVAALKAPPDRQAASTL